MKALSFPWLPATWCTRILVVSAFFLTINLRAQEAKVIITGTVSDSSGRTLNGVSIQVQKNTTVTDRSGEFFIYAARTAKMSVKATLLGYEKYSYDLLPGELRKDTVVINIVLRQKVFEIGTVEISSSTYRPVMEIPHVHVLDFEFMGDDFIVLAREKRTTYLWMVDSLYRPKFRVPVTATSTGLQYDCHNRLRLLTADSVFYVQRYDSTFTLTDPLVLKAYNELFVPCVAASDSITFWRSANRHNKEILFLRSDSSFTAPVLIKRVYDEIGEREADYNFRLAIVAYLVLVPEPNLISLGMWDGRAESIRIKPRVTMRYQISARPLKCQLMLYDSLVVIFDHFIGEHSVYRLNGANLLHRPVNYHLVKGFRQIMKDHSRDLFYAVFDHNGDVAVHPLHPLTGELGKATVISERDFPAKLKVRNGHLYYLHSKEEENPFVKLYTQPVADERSAALR